MYKIIAVWNAIVYHLGAFLRMDVTLKFQSMIDRAESRQLVYFVRPPKIFASMYCKEPRYVSRTDSKGRMKYLYIVIPVGLLEHEYLARMLISNLANAMLMDQWGATKEDVNDAIKADIIDFCKMVPGFAAWMTAVSAMINLEDPDATKWLNNIPPFQLPVYEGLKLDMM